MKFNLKKFLLIATLAILSLIPLLWFRSRAGFLINGVDTNFPLDPLVWFKRRFFVWYPLPNAGVDFSSSISGLFFHFVQVVPYVLGFTLQRVELMSFIFWFCLIIVSSFFLAKELFPKKSIIQILFVVFYSFNIYMFNSWENVKVANLSLVAGLPFAIYILILLEKKRISLRTSILPAFIVGIIVSGTGINPAYFISFLFVLFLFLFGGLIAGEDRKNKIIQFLVVVGVIFLANSFWILPTFNFILRNIPAQGSLGKIGFNNWLDSLSQNTSILNILRLQGAWDWYPLDSNTGLPFYIPYALRYFYSLPFLIFSVVPVFLSFVSLIFRNQKERSLYLSFLIMLVVGVFLGVGTHMPTGRIFKFLLDHMPFFNLFRSPWYIFTPLVTLAYAGLMGLLFYNLNVTFSFRFRILKLIAPLLALILIIGNLFYCYPLVTGKIFRPSRPDGFYVKFPSYVFEAAKWLSKDTNGRIIGYPDDENEKFSWGYRGIESILQLLVDRDVLFSPLNATQSPVALLIRQFYASLRRGQLEAMESAAAKLNVSLIFHKEDQPSLAPPMSEKFKSLPSHRFGEWVFYSLPADVVVPKIYSAGDLVYSYPYEGNTQVFSVLGKGTDVINPDDSVVKSISQIPNFLGFALLGENSQLDNLNIFLNSGSMLYSRFAVRDFSGVSYAFDVPEDGLYQPKLERYHVEDFGIDTNKSLSVEVDGKSMMWTIDQKTDSYLVFPSREFKKGKHLISFKLKDDNLLLGGDFETGERFGKGGLGGDISSYEIKEDQNGKFLCLYNMSNKDRTVDFKIPNLDPFATYYVGLKYKYIYGSTARVTAAQYTTRSPIKAQIENLPSFPDWQKFGFYFQPVETGSEIEIFLTASPTTDQLGTRVCYDDVFVKKVFLNNLSLVKKAQNTLSVPQIDFKKSSPVFYEGTVSNATGPHLLVFSENYSSEWQMELTDLEGKPISFSPKHFSINLYANAWFLEKMPESYRFRIYYKPQNFLNLGVFITGVTFLISLVFYLGRKR